jgi:hypothetical protein
MDSLLWFREVQQRLAKHGLPASYIARFVAELTDHFHDLTEETMSTEAKVCSRLGEPAQVADAARAAYRRRSFVGRHPTAAFLVFAISPVVPQFGLGYVVAGILAVILPRLIGAHGWGEDEIGPVAAAAWCGIFSLMIVMCSILASILYCELARRLGFGKKWIFTSCTVLATLAVLWEYSLHESIGFYGVVLPMQFMVPLVVGWWFAQRKCGQSYPVTSFFVFAVSPFMLLILLCFAASLVLRGAITSFDFTRMINSEHCGPVAWAAWSYGFTLVLVVIPSIMASLVYCGLARRMRISNKWLLVSCAILAALAGVYSVHVADGSGRPTALCDDIGFYDLTQLVQFIMPLAIGWWFLRSKRHQTLPQMAS